MRTLPGSAVAALAGSVVPVVQLVLFSFAAPIALSTANLDLEFGGITYRGAFGLGNVSEIDDSPGEIKGLQFTLAGVDAAYIALALDDAAVVQGTKVTIRTAILDGNTYRVVDAPIEWSGTLDTMTIAEDGDTCTIQVTAESTAVDLLRGAPLTYSHADQRLMAPEDRAFQYVLSQANTPVVWPTRQWYIDKGQR